MKQRIFLIAFLAAVIFLGFGCRRGDGEPVKFAPPTSPPPAESNAPAPPSK